jgi:hypothetical protein
MLTEGFSRINCPIVLQYTEPSNFALVALMRSGVPSLHEICNPSDLESAISWARGLGGFSLPPSQGRVLLRITGRHQSREHRVGIFDDACFRVISERSQSHNNQV